MKKNRIRTDYSGLDHPGISMLLFHPRKESPVHRNETDSREKHMDIPVDKNVRVGACFHMIEKKAPNILFFHGNGEIVSDYNELGPVYNQRSLNFLAVDYRGYGKSNGSPTASTMMMDCHVIFQFVKNWLAENAYSGSLFVMGRSLGSASAMEIGYHNEKHLSGLIIESGFSYTVPLLKLLGVDTEKIGITENNGFQNKEKISQFSKPALIIHSENDHIIPFSDGKALYNACPASDKYLKKIKGADHNTIFQYGLSEYMESIQNFTVII